MRTLMPTFSTKLCGTMLPRKLGRKALAKALASAIDSRVRLRQLTILALQHMHASIVDDNGRKSCATDIDDETAGRTIRLSSVSVHDGRPMLAVFEVLADGTVRLAVHAEDAIGGNILLDELQRSLRGDTPQRPGD